MSNRNNKISKMRKIKEETKVPKNMDKRIKEIKTSLNNKDIKSGRNKMNI